MSSSQDPDEVAKKLAKLKELKKAYRDCVECPMHATRKQIVFADGEPDSLILIVGQAPTEQEEIAGTPFLGKSGIMLDDLLRRAGSSRSEVHIINSVLCLPPDNRAPSNTELGKCRPRLMAHIRILDPDVIIVLGKIALKAVSGRNNASITSERGKMFELIVPGLKLPLVYPVMPTYDPNYLLRDPDQSPGGLVYQTVSDLKNALSVADKLNKHWRGVKTPKRVGR